MRRLLSPRWLGRHLLTIACVLALVALGRWQWHRAHESDGTLQNLFYAVQWVGFAGFVIFLWWKVLREELHPAPAGPPRLSAGSVDAPGGYPPPLAADEQDEELAAYNRYLAELAELAERAERAGRAQVAAPPRPAG